MVGAAKGDAAVRQGHELRNLPGMYKINSPPCLLLPHVRFFFFCRVSAASIRDCNYSTVATSPLETRQLFHCALIDVWKL